MHIALTQEQENLREELREYFDQLVTPEVRAGLSTATNDFSKGPGSSGEFGDLPGFRASFERKPAQLVLDVLRGRRVARALMQ